jgi:hypothetical protein
MQFASRIKKKSQRRRIFFVRNDSLAFFRLLALGFSVNPLDPLLEKNSTDRWGVLFFDQKHHMTEFIAPAPTAVAADNVIAVNDHAIETINEANTPLILSSSLSSFRDNTDSSSDKQ